MHKNDWHSYLGKNGHFSKKISFRVYSATFNTNISMIWLHKNDCSYIFFIKLDPIRTKFISKNIFLNSILIFPCYDYIKAIKIPDFNVKMNTLRRNFIMGNILLNSILIFQCYDCIKTIDIPNFSVKKDTFQKKISIWEILC